MPDVTHNPARHRYELTIDGHTALTEYRKAGPVVTFVHTQVPEALGGRGVGSALAKGALQAVRRDGLRVVAQCPFIAGYIAKHPEFQDLLAQ